MVAFLCNNSDPRGVSGVRCGPGVTECKTERCCASPLALPGAGAGCREIIRDTGPGERRDAGNESRASHPCNHNIRDNAGDLFVFIVNKNGGSRIGK